MTNPGKTGRSWTGLFAIAAVVVAGLALVLFYRGGDRGPVSPGGPLAIRRITQDQYKTIIADIFGGDIKIGGRFEPDIRKSGLLAVGTSEVTVTPTGFEQYDKMARGIAEQVVDEQHRASLVRCKPASVKEQDDACTKQVLARVGRLLYRRPLTEPELNAQIAVAAAATKRNGDYYAGLAMGLAGLLEGSHFLFRYEVAEPDPDHAGGHRLTAYSKASRLSFFLWNTTPDDALLTAAESGELNSSKGLARQVDRLMASPRLEDGVRSFFADMLGFDAFGQLAKDTLIYPKFVPAVIGDSQEQTLRTIVDHLLVQRGDYRDLFTTRKTFLTPLLGSIYRVPVMTREGWEAHEFPVDDPHAGLLTEVSFLALHSHPGRSSPTLRGKALREVLLCEKVPDPPGNVNFNLVQDTTNPQFKTARARLTAHATNPVCMGCHKLIDPMGLALENFNSSGSYRTAENDAPIDAGGELDGMKFADAAGLGKAMHDDPATPTCLVNRVFSYAAGRAATKRESEWMAYLEKRFAADGYRLPDLIREIATSDGFYSISMNETVAMAPTAMPASQRESGQ